MSAATASSIELRSLDAPFGAEIAGVDLSQPLGAGTFERIRDAYFEHSLVVFHGQQFLTSSWAADDSFVPAANAAAFMQGEFDGVRKVIAASGKN